MKTFGIVLGLILLSGSTRSYGQANEQEPQTLNPQKTQSFQVDDFALFAEPQTRSVFQTRGGTKAEPTAALQTNLEGTWWREPNWIQTLNLTPDQQKKMDDAFRQNRIKLIDLTATLEKAELLLEPLVENVRPGDEAKILGQIDDVANARAELEKANARMLLAIREVLTQEQWSKLPKANSFSYRINNGKFYWPTPPTTPTPSSVPGTK
jgi:Spy/CpxP family protein refolding chaperone